MRPVEFSNLGKYPRVYFKTNSCLLTLCTTEWQNRSLESKLLPKNTSYLYNNGDLGSLLNHATGHLRMILWPLTAFWEFAFLDSAELSQLVICSYKYLATAGFPFTTDEIWHFPLLLTISNVESYHLFGSWTLSNKLYSCSYTEHCKIGLGDHPTEDDSCDLLHLRSQHKNQCASTSSVCTHLLHGAA